MNIGVMIIQYLEINGITNTFLSRKTGIDAVRLNLALNGNRRMTFDEYALICAVISLELP